MAHNNGIITAPVNVMADIGYVLGTGSGDIGVNCTSNNINKWAKFKPVKSNFPGVLSAAQLAAANYGLVAPQKGNAEDVLDAVWTYEKPIGAPSQWFRSLDFVDPDNPTMHGYAAGAMEPVASIGSISINYGLVSQYSFQLPFRNIPPRLAPNNIKVSELLPIKGYYLCMAFSSGQYFGGAVYFKTIANTFEEMGASEAVTLTASEIASLRQAGVSYYLVCACEHAQHTLAMANSADKFMALPCDNVPATTKGTISITNDIASSMLVMKLSQEITPTSDADFNITFRPNTRISCSVVTDYFVHLKVGISALAEADLHMSNVRADVVGTLFGNDISVEDLLVDVYDENFSNKNNVTIQAGETGVVYLVFRATFLNVNQKSQRVDVPAGNSVDSTVTFKQGSGKIGTSFINAKSVL